MHAVRRRCLACPGAQRRLDPRTVLCAPSAFSSGAAQAAKMSTARAEPAPAAADDDPRYSHWSLIRDSQRQQQQMSSVVALEYYCSDFSWDELRERVGAAVASKPVLERERAERLLRGRGREGCNWQAFYRQHDNANVYKPRRYVAKLWPQLIDAGAGVQCVLELGCGYGSTLLPLVQLAPCLRVIGTDVSALAVERFRDHPLFDPLRCSAAVHNAADSPIDDVVQPGSVDAVLLVFALSAMPPDRHAWVLQQAARALRPGGAVLLRDYGLYDLSQVRSGNRIDGSLYAREDGTLTYFFSREGLAELAAQAGLRPEANDYHTVSNTNRKHGLRLERVYLTATLRKPACEGGSGAAHTGASSSAGCGHVASGVVDGGAGADGGEECLRGAAVGGSEAPPPPPAAPCSLPANSH